MEEGIRFDKEQQAWKDWEQRAESKFGKETIISSEFQRDYLSHLEDLEIKYRLTANKYERMELNLLKAKRREIEKFLYPNWLVRSAYRIIRSNEMKRASTVQALSRDGNINRLVEVLAKKGFLGIEEQLRNNIKGNQPEFHLPATFQVGEGLKMKYQVRISKDNNDEYIIRDIQATLNDDQKGSTQSLLYGSIPGTELTMGKALNLLSGRSIETSDGWVTLDINDKDAEGNLRSKLFNQAYGYHIERLFDQMGIKDADDPTIRKIMIQHLKNGDSLKVQVGEEVKEIEANPLHHCLEKPEIIIARRQEQLQEQLKAESMKEAVVEEVKETETVKMRVG